MERYTDTDIINDAIDFLSIIPDEDKPVLTVWEAVIKASSAVFGTPKGSIIHEGMRYFASSTGIINDKMVRTLQTYDLNGNYLNVNVKNIWELHVYWDHLKYRVPQNLRDPLLVYLEPKTNAGATVTDKAVTDKAVTDKAVTDKAQPSLLEKPKLTAPLLRKISIGNLQREED